MSKKLEAMREGGKKLAEIRDRVTATVRPGVKLMELDRLAEILIDQSGGEAAFKRVPGYRWATCINVNAGVVHGIPDDYEIKPGDVVSVDVGLYYQGYYTDTATSVAAGKGSQATARFLQAGKQALIQAVGAARARRRVGHISQAIEAIIKAYGYQPVQALTGHGVGRSLHEPPAIPGWLGGDVAATAELKTGMTLAIEVIYAQGSPEVVREADGWTVRTADGQLAGLFEKTVVVTEGEAEVLTT